MKGGIAIKSYEIHWKNDSDRFGTDISISRKKVFSNPVPKYSFSTASYESPNELDEIVQLIRNQTGNDFSQYKKSTVQRQIERRMSINESCDMSHYKEFLRQNPQELEMLFNELLIGVTSFFRDKEVFEDLQENIIPDLIRSRIQTRSLRVWIPGCSTGEEAYSIAIILKECLENLNLESVIKISIFATDLNCRAIEIARRGIYPANIASDISVKRLSLFFMKVDNNGYQIKKNIREMVVFAPQNILSDPPFIKLDMLSCRNLLIYFSTELHKRLLPIFHYALNPGGFLLLGSSETVGGFGNLFSIKNNKCKIYERKDTLRGVFPVMHFQARSGLRENIERDCRKGPDGHSFSEKAQIELEKPITSSAVVAELESRLMCTNEYLQSALEEMEATQEELKTANEELQLTNDELQNANEELKTSREELQSLNEELLTINSDLQTKNDSLEQSNNDMRNLLYSTKVAAVSLDNNLKIKGFTPEITKIINLIQTDVGRPLSDIVQKLKYRSVIADVGEVLSSLGLKEVELEATDGNWFMMRILPYRTIENGIDGVIITFNDITLYKQLEKELEQTKALHGISPDSREIRGIQRQDYSNQI